MDTTGILDGFDFDRRDFLRLGLMTSAACLASASMTSVAKDSDASPTYAKLHSLPPGAIRPEGWLRIYLERQAQ
jgi:hypothetical protein